MPQKLFAIAGLVLAAALAGAGCVRQEAPRQPVATSYPSPDFPPAQGAVGPAASQPPAAGAPPLAERPLAAPVARPAGAPPMASPAAAPAPAAPPASAAAPANSAALSAIDADGNGRITLEEWRNFQEREFRRLDRNNDGVISREETAAPGSSRAASARPAP